MPLPKPLDLQRFYILLALAKQPLRIYSIHAQVMSDSRQSLYFSVTSLYRLVRQLTASGLIEQTDEMYSVTAKGRNVLRLTANDLHVAATLTTERIHK